MKSHDDKKLCIGGWRVDPSLDEISTDGKTVKLEPRAMRLLVCLAEHAPQVVSVEQLLQEAWKDVIVTSDSVYHVVAALRRMLGDDGRDCSYIATVPRRGYRLVVPVAPWVDELRQNSMVPAVEAPIVTHAVDPTGSSSHRARILLSSVVVLALGYVVVDKFWLSPPSQRALALAPNDAAATFYAARLSTNVGRFDEALTQVNAALAQDPLSAGYYQVLDWIQARRGHLPEAEAAARRALEISPTFDSAHFFLGLVLLERGEPEAARAEMEKETLTGGQLAGLAMAYYALGRRAESDAALARMIRELGNSRAFQIAEACAFRGERDRAFHWLERAYAQKESDLQYIKVDVPLKNLEFDSRYGAFLRKMNLAE
jgi:DNA-binding winged helix-turn-helix (wHTH) protein/Tfp pilus assembly protein PilF